MEPLARANVSDVCHWLSRDKVAGADLNWMVTERSDSQFAGLVKSWTGRLVKSRNAVFKIALYRVAQKKITHYHESSLNRIKTGHQGYTFIYFDYKMSARI